MAKIYDQDNIFAKILRGEIPCIRLYEDEKTLAFMDVMPQGRGHFLVVPRAPSRNLLDAEPETLAYTIQIVQKLAKAAQEALHADGVSIMQFNEDAGGQSVFHLHFHIIPRFAGIELQSHSDKMADIDELEEVAALIRAKI